MAVAKTVGYDLRNMTRNMENLLGLTEQMNTSMMNFNVDGIGQMGNEYSKVSTAMDGIADKIDTISVAQNRSNTIVGMAEKNLKNYIASGNAVKDVFDFYNEAVSGANTQINAERNAAIAMQQHLEITGDQITAVKEFAKEQEKAGVISDQVQMSGITQLSKYVNSYDTLSTLLPAMNDLAVSQMGTNVTSESIAGIGDTMGAAMGGDLSGIINMGVTFDDEQLRGFLNGSDLERASILTAAIAESVGDMNEEMAQMPEGVIQQASNAWQNMKENIGTQLYPAVMNLFGAINTNLPMFEPMIKTISTEFGVLINVIAGIISIIGGIGKIMFENWDIIGPIMSAVIALTIMLGTYMLITAGATAIMTAAQAVLNVVMSLNPIGLIIAAVILLIAVFFSVIAVINRITGTTLSAVGVICGVISSAGAIIWNIIAGVINGVIQLFYSIFVVPFLEIIEWVINVFSGGFDSFGDAVANLLGNIISWFLGLGKVVTTIIDAIFGTNWTDGLTDLQAEVTSWGKNENSFTMSEDLLEAPTAMERKSVGEAWYSGYSWGEGVQNSFGGSDSDLTNMINSYTSGSNDFGNVLNNNTINSSDYGNMLNENNGSTIFSSYINNNLYTVDNDFGLDQGQAANYESINNNMSFDNSITNNIADTMSYNREREAEVNQTQIAQNVTIDMSGTTNIYNDSEDSFEVFKSKFEEYINEKMNSSAEGALAVFS